MGDYALTLSDDEIDRYQRMAQAAHEAEAELWRAAGIGDGAVVADVGCGPGAMSSLLARIVGAAGQVWAVDQDAGALAAADALADRLGLRNLRTRQGDATATGIDPGTVDVAMMRHVLAHNGGREQAIVYHLASLVRPGGSVYLADIDATAVHIRPAPEGLFDINDRYFEFQTARGNDLSIGLRLAELLQGAGLEIVAFRGHIDIIPVLPGFRSPSWAARHSMVEAGAATPADLDRWAAGFELLDRGDLPGLTMFLPLYCAIGRRQA